MSARKKVARPRLRLARRRAQHVHQFLVVLTNTEPLVWRRVQVPEDYSFWDLHVAIQDAMGWLDCHLHEFTVVHPKRRRIERLGIPDKEIPEAAPCKPGWNARVTEYFDRATPPALYTYDFGDDWQHVLFYEGTGPAEPSHTYPRCVAGARACPPEDCGGPHQYQEFLAAIRDPRHPEHAQMIAWAGADFDPDAFDPKRPTFDDPRVRWERAFKESGGTAEEES